MSANYLPVCATGDDLMFFRMVANSSEQSVGQHHLISDKTPAGTVCQGHKVCNIMRDNQNGGKFNLTVQLLKHVEQYNIY